MQVLFFSTFHHLTFKLIKEGFFSGIRKLHCLAILNDHVGLTWCESDRHICRLTRLQLGPWCNFVLEGFIWRPCKSIRRLARLILEPDHPSMTSLAKER